MAGRARHSQRECGVVTLVVGIQLAVTIGRRRAHVKQLGECCIRTCLEQAGDDHRLGILEGTRRYEAVAAHIADRAAGAGYCQVRPSARPSVERAP